MKKSLSQESIREIALEAGVEPAFIEKDWLAVQLVALLGKHKNDKGVQVIFSGGTSLSKGYDLIQRFSEDLDFFLATEDRPLSQGQRRSYRHNLLSHLVQDHRFAINDEEVERGDSSRFFKAPITYARSFDQASLRAYLQLEMTFCEPRLPIEVRKIRSIAAAVMGEEAEASISCVSPLETAGDKLSAFTWRVVVRDRDAEKDDPTMIRHLHDLAALEATIHEGETSFVAIARQSLEQDQLRRGGDAIRGMSVQDRLDKSLAMLRKDKLYRDEYEQFVLAMSYAEEDSRIDFEGACSALERIINIYVGS